MEEQHACRPYDTSKFESSTYLKLSIRVRVWLGDRLGVFGNAQHATGSPRRGTARDPSVPLVVSPCLFLYPRGKAGQKRSASRDHESRHTDYQHVIARILPTQHILGAMHAQFRRPFSPVEACWTRGCQSPTRRRYPSLTSSGPRPGRAEERPQDAEAG